MSNETVPIKHQHLVYGTQVVRKIVRHHYSVTMVKTQNIYLEIGNILFYQEFGHSRVVILPVNGHGTVFQTNKEIDAIHEAGQAGREHLT